MAKRFVFRPVTDKSGILFSETLVDFDWIAGMSKSQNQKWIRNLHRAAREKMGIERVLEISSRSELSLGVELSAFNLNLQLSDLSASVECIYQGSKVYENGGPFTDLYSRSSKEAKQDPRLKLSGNLTHFEFNGRVWKLSESPNFYDYLYILALSDYSKSNQLLDYQAFTDFAYSQSESKFSHGRSFNCQARSAAIYVSLCSLNQLGSYLEDPEKFSLGSGAASQTEISQLNLFDT
jgi:hypothetical protein